MPIAGKGMLITWMDIDPAEEADFNLWYDREHLAERVGIEGFVEARRWIAADEQPGLQGRTGQPDGLVEEAHLGVPQSRTGGRASHP